MGADVVLDAPAVRRWFDLAAVALHAKRRDIDALNVFPVADSDTGSNLLQTWLAAGGALGDPGPGERLPGLLAAAARGALLGARGNSGVILCQFLHGFAGGLTADIADGPAVAAALGRATTEARAAVVRPVLGTILTVAEAAARGAAGAVEAGTPELLAVLAAAESAATAALARTPEQLPVLADAGVVDAGGAGWLVVLSALRTALDGAADAAMSSGKIDWLAPVNAAGVDVGMPTARGPLAPLHGDGGGSGGSDADGFGYEVQYLLAGGPDAVAALRTELAALGGSLVIVGGADLWQVHVHVDDAGAAVEAGVRAGIPSRITVTRFSDSVPPEPTAAVALAADRSPAAGPPAPQGHPANPAIPGSRVVLAVVPGPAFAALFEAAGARTLVAPNLPTDAAFTAALETARGAGASEVVIIPNGVDVTVVAQRAAAKQHDRRWRRSVVVVPTTSPVQGLAALAVADPQAPLEDALVAMAEAAGATRVGEISVAVGTALTSAGTCHRGDILAMQGGDVVLIGRTVDDVSLALLDRLLDGGGELVTLITGAGAPTGLTDRLSAHLDVAYPLAEVTVFDGGQPSHPLLIGVE